MKIGSKSHYYYIPEIGDRFQDDNKNIFRIVEVVRVSKNSAQIKNITPTSSGKPSNRLTWTKFESLIGPSSRFTILYGRCHKCQIKQGAVMPKDGFRNITMSEGTCVDCLNPKAALIPSCDYNWPKQGVQAIFD